MKTDLLREMIVRVRRVRSPDPIVSRPPDLPPGRAREIVLSHRRGPSARLLRFQNWSYAGLGVAAAIAFSVPFSHRSPEITPSDPADPWMEMPMSELTH